MIKAFFLITGILCLMAGSLFALVSDSKNSKIVAWFGRSELFSIICKERNYLEFEKKKRLIEIVLFGGLAIAVFGIILIIIAKKI